jgi:hypothetical protein
MDFAETGLQTKASMSRCPAVWRAMAVLVALAAPGSSPLRAESTRLLLPLPIAGAAALAPATDADHFEFAVAGDNRSTDRGVPMPPTAGQIFSEYRLLRPAFSLWTGDTIYGAEESVGEAEAEWDGFLAAAARAQVPIFNAPGNHEISLRPELAALYERKAGRLYGSFDYGHCHFVALDTEEVGRTPGIGPAQQAWLEADLAANSQAAAIFVLMHHPLFPKQAGQGWADPAIRDAVHRLFVRHGVRFVFAGHEHLYNLSVHDGVNYVVTGGAGAPVSQTPETGGFEHYLLVSVNGREVAVTVVAPWRLFSSIGPVQPDGSCSARIDNYDGADFLVTVEFPTDMLAGHAAASAVFAYKGSVHPLSAQIVPSPRPGATDVRVTVPRGRSAFVTLAPAKP